MKTTSIKISTLFLQVVIVLVAVGALTFLLWEPHVEGVNANATTLAQIYLDDPFLAYAYASSILFFILLYQAFMVVGYVRNDTLFSPTTRKSVRTIKRCATALVVLVAAPLAYLFIVRPGDDSAGGVAMGLVLILVSAVTAAAATVGEEVLQNGEDRVGSL